MVRGAAPILTRLREFWGASSWISVALLAGVAASAIAWGIAADLVERRQQAEFRSQAVQATELIRGRLESYTQVLRGLQSLFRIKSEVTRAEFRRYLEGSDLPRLFPGYQAVHFSRLVPAADKERFVDAVRRDRSLLPQGYPGFAVAPPGERPEYLVIDYVEPYAGNEGAMGFDVYSREQTRGTVEQARDTGRSAATGPYTLFQDSGSPRMGYVLTLPVYRIGAPLDTVEQRRAAFCGVVSAAFRIEELMARILDLETRAGLGFVIDDLGSPEEPGAVTGRLFSWGEPDTAAQRFMHSAEIPVGSHRWRMRVFHSHASSPYFQALPVTVAISGLVTTGLLALLVALLFTGQRRAAALAGDMTRELRDSEERLRVMIETIPMPIIFSRRRDGHVLFINHWTAEYFGVRRQEGEGRTAYDYYADPEDRRPVGERLRRDGFVRDYETRFRKADGTVFWGALSIQSAVFQGEPAVLAVVQDISARRAAEAALRESEELNRVIAETIPIALSVTRLEDGAVVSHSPRFREIFEIAADGEEFPAIAQYDAPSDRERFLEALRRQGAVRDFEVRMKTRGGRRFWGLLSARTVLLRGEQVIVAATQDISFLKETEAALRQANQVLQTIIETSPLAIFALGPDYRVTLWNPAAERLFGWSAQEAVGGFSPILPKEQTEDGLVLAERIRAGREITNVEITRRRRDGSRVLLDLAAAPLRDPGGQMTGVMVIAADITERKRAEEALRLSEERFRALTENASDIILVVGEDKKILYESPSARRLLGYGGEERRGQSAFSNTHPDDLPLLEAAFAKAFSAPEETILARFRVRCGDGSWRIFEAVAINCLANPAVRGIVVNARDVTERQQSEERLAFLAQHDTLTGLPNRNLMMDRLSQAMVQAHRSGKRVAILFVDLDRFKTINDSLGHEAGDRLLQTVGSRLLGCVREGDTVARQGGDEFLVILPEIGDAGHASQVAGKMLEAIHQPMVLDRHELHVSPSIGISIFPEDGATAEHLIKNADIAMYQAKAGGRDQYRYFTSEMNTLAQRRLTLEHRLRQGLAEGEFLLHYQPEVDLATGRITAVEALVRWNYRGEGEISPAEFIPAAEETGLILPLGEWVLTEACRQIRRWRDAGHASLSVAVNLSGRQFRQKGLAQRIRGILAESGLGADALELEITESSVMENPDRAAAILRELRAAGIDVATDDFGTGYSSLAYLKRFPIGKLKIDRSFVRDITTDKDDAAIVGAIIAMTENLGLRVVAEGVETAEQLAFLRAHGCGYGQGYYFSRPLPAEALDRLLAVDQGRFRLPQAPVIPFPGSSLP